MAAFAGEAQAHLKYQIYGAKAKEEKQNLISSIFYETARNEKEHAELWFKFLHDGFIQDSSINLIDAAKGEHYEWTEMYKEFAITAKEEGFNEIARLFGFPQGYGCRFQKEL